MLGTISRDSLIQLDISNNAFAKQEISNLKILFKKNSNSWNLSMFHSVFLTYGEGQNLLVKLSN